MATTSSGTTMQEVQWTATTITGNNISPMRSDILSKRLVHKTNWFLFCSLFDKCNTCLQLDPRRYTNSC